MEHAGLRQGCTHHRQHAAHQEAPGPEEVEQRTIGQESLIGLLHRAPGLLGIEQRRLPEAGDAQLFDEFFKCGAITARQCNFQKPKICLILSASPRAGVRPRGHTSRMTSVTSTALSGST